MKNLLIHKLTTRFLSTAMSVTMAVGLVMGGAGVAFASGTPVAGGFTIEGTPAAMDHTGPTINGSTPVGIDGTNQDILITLPITVTDYSGTGAGWNVSLTATKFSGDGHTLEDAPTVAATPTVTNAPPVNATSATYTTPSDSGAVSVLTPLSATTPQVLANAGVGSGMGRFTIDPTINQVIRANAYASANYSSDFTVSFINSPTLL